MRLDKLLQATGIVKRRTRAQELCRAGYVRLDGHRAKAGKEVRAGQRLKVQLGRSVLTFEVRQIPRGPVPKSQRADVVHLLKTQTVDDEK
ncbi:MAG: S4 domain-containing protein [Armatimonadota bacterium]